MPHKSLLFGGLRSTLRRKLLPRPPVSDGILVTHRQRSPQPIEAAIGTLHLPSSGYTAAGWIVERGTFLTLVSQVWIALPRASSTLRGWNVGHFHTRP